MASVDGLDHVLEAIEKLQPKIQALVTKDIGDVEIDKRTNRMVVMDDLPSHLRLPVVDLENATLDLPESGVDLRIFLTQLEERLIAQALERTGGNKGQAARLLNLKRTTLVEKIKRLQAHRLKGCQ